MRVLPWLVIAAALLAGSCSSSEDMTSPGGSEDATAPAGEIADAGDGSAAGPATAEDDVGARYLDGEASYLFDQARLRTYELTLSADDLAFLDADPAAEEYVEGSLTFEGETIERVGIRYKGSVGAFVGCLSNPDFFNPSGEKTCTKLSMKVKTNWLDPDDTFYGVKKLQFHSQNLDVSQLRERLGYWLNREMGVPAPRSVHARLVVNGEYLGVFALTEQIDGRFARENFADGSGNVYKEVWPVGSDGQPHDEGVYRSALETNEDEDPSVDLIRDFGAELGAASTDADRRAVVEQYLDVEETLALMVVDRTIRNDDGPLHFYCGVGGEGCANHNYYWYEDPAEARLHLIPWDLDNAFENIVLDANPVTPIADGWGEITADCEPFEFGGFGIAQRSAACDPLIAALVLFEEEYERALASFLAGPFSAERVDVLIEAWTMQIAHATAEAAAAHGDAVSVDRWRAEVDRLRDSLQYARDNA